MPGGPRTTPEAPHTTPTASNATRTAPHASEGMVHRRTAYRYGSAAPADVRPVWCPGRGPNPAPAFLVRWHLADGTAHHHPAGTEAEARAFAHDASDSMRTEAAVYRLCGVLTD